MQKTYFVKLNHIRVAHFLQDLDLSWYPLNVLFVFDTGFLKNFNCYFFRSQNMLCHFNFSEGSFPQWLPKNIMSKFLAFCMRIKLLGLLLFSLSSLNLVSSLLIFICIYAESKVLTNRNHILKLQNWSCFFSCHNARLSNMSGRAFFAISSIFLDSCNLNVLTFSIIICYGRNPWHTFLLI